MKMVERVARAICTASGIDPDRKYKSSDGGAGTAPHELAWRAFQPEARAAMGAMRTLRAGHPILNAGMTTREFWRRAIDAALNE